MQRVDGERKTFVALVDADGCFYNPIADILLRYLIADYSDRIEEFFEHPVFATFYSDEILAMKMSIMRNAEIFSRQLQDNHKITIAKSVSEKLVRANYQHIVDSNLPASSLNQIKFSYANFLCEVAELKEVYQTLILAANEHLLSHIESAVKHGRYQHVSFVSGSNRQSQMREAVNILNNGTRAFVFDLADTASFVAESINADSDAAIGCEFDGFLLADIYSGMHDGHSFNLIRKEIELADNNEEFLHHDYVFDETKFTLLYAMLHRAGVKYEGHAVTVAFFDDRVDIHDVITRIFKAHPDLIPANVTLECYHYEGLELNHPLSVIQGIGMIDHHYRDNIKKIIELCGFSASEYEKAVNTGAVILSDNEMPLLAAFKELRALHHPEQHEFASMFQHALTLFSHPETSRSDAAAAASMANDARSGYQAS